MPDSQHCMYELLCYGVLTIIPQHFVEWCLMLGLVSYTLLSIDSSSIGSAEKLGLETMQRYNHVI